MKGIFNWLIFRDCPGFLILLAVLLFFGATPLPAQTSLSENIREKVKLLEGNGSLNNGDDIFCVSSVIDVYKKRAYRAVWSDPKRISQFTEIIEESYQHGLTPSDYHLSEIKELLASKTIDQKGRLDLFLTDAFLLFTAHITSGKVDPKSIGAQWHLARTNSEPSKYLEEIVHTPIPDLFDRLYPQNRNYNLLREKLAEYRAMAEKGGWGKIESGSMLKPGMTDQRIPLVRKRLAVTGEMGRGTADTSAFYDRDLLAAVVLFQQRNGLEALGNIGPETTYALNIPVEERIKTLEVNLERWRWLPVEFSPYYLLVNIANFELELIDHERLLSVHKVIVGRPYRKTPVFSSTLQYLVINPIWTVPATIRNNDLIPEIRKDLRTLEKKKINVYSAEGKKLNPDSVNWGSQSVYSYTYRQEAGRMNALGALKFYFPNSYNVYLHDTPQKELFERSQRAFSTGCIRVQDPVDLAVILLNDSVNWSKSRIQKAIKTNQTQTVMLRRKPEVYLLYWTAWVDRTGQLHFGRDLYNRDSMLYEALKARPVYEADGVKKRELVR